MILFNVMTSPRLAPLTDIKPNCVHSTPATASSQHAPSLYRGRHCISRLNFYLMRTEQLWYGFRHLIAETARLLSFHSYNRSTSQMMKLTLKIHGISQTHRQQFWEIWRGILYWRIDEDDQVIFHRFYQTELSASIILK